MKNRNKSHFGWLGCMLFFLGSANTHAQLDQIMLSGPDAGTKTYIANERIEFLPGYTYTPSNQMVAYIDPGVLAPPFYTNMFSSSEFDNRQLNAGYAVGSSSGSPRVTETGAFTYHMPIQIPIGTNNMMPQLSFGYNSQRGNGLLGMGWNLQGLSVISRVNKDLYHDAEVKAVKFNNEDVFALDGAKLLGISGTYGANNAEYATESEDFARVYSRGILGSGPQWFEVKTKEGMTIEYGKTADSRLAHNSDVLYWLINRIRDRNGNYVEYIYETVAGELRIKEIRYTGNETTNLQPYNLIQFNYKERADPFDYFIHYKKVENRNVLDNIVISVEGQQYKKYEFKYGCKLYTFLNEVIEYGTGTQRYNSTIFKYATESEGQPEIKQQQVLETTLAFNNFNNLSGDFNGDGRMDIAKVTASDNSSTVGNVDGAIVSNNINFEILTNSNENDLEFQSIGGVNITSPSFISIGYQQSYFQYNKPGYGMNLFDFNGDGKTDIFYYELHYDGPNDRFSISDARYREAEVNSQGNVSFVQKTGFDNLDPSYRFVRNVNQFSFSGDFNGDGITDVLYVTQNAQGNSFKTGIIKGSHTVSSMWTIGVQNQAVVNFSDGLMLASADRVEVIDYDGDGKSDLMITKGTNTKIYTFRKGQTHPNGPIYENYAELLYEAGFPTAWHKFDIGDFNGDGRADLLTTSADGNLYTIHYSRTNNWFQPVDYTFKNAPYNAVEDGLTVADLNGDGKTDIIHFFSQHMNGLSLTEQMSVYYSAGTRFKNELSTLSIPLTQADTMMSERTFRYDRVITGNLKPGSNAAVIVPVKRMPNYGIEMPWVEYYELDLNLNRNLNAMTHVKDGFNNEFAVQYDHIDNSTIGAYAATPTNLSASPNYPVSNFNQPVLIAKKLTSETATGSTADKDFAYWGGKIHRRGRGMLGFSKVEEMDELTGITTSMEYTFDSPIFQPYMRKTSTFFTQNQQPISETVYGHSFVPLNNDRYLYYISEETHTDHVHDRTLSTVSEFDNVTGNLISTTVDNNGLETTFTEYTSYGTFGTDLNVPNKITESTTTITRTGQVPFARTSIFEYDLQTGDLLKTIQDAGTAESITKQLEYNINGNVTKEILSANGLQPRIKQYLYDARRRYPIRHTNELGQQSFMEYHPVFGKPQKVTDIHGLVTESSFDQFGRETQMVDPLGNTTSIAILWENTSPPNQGNNPLEANNAMWKVVTTATGKPQSTTYMNRLGMPRMTKEQGMNGDIYTVTSYTERGETQTETVPFYLGATDVLTNAYTYDELNRVTSASNQAGTTTMAYSVNAGNLVTTITSPSSTSKSSEEDATGNLVKSSDEGGVLTYTYFSHGGVKEIKLDGVTVSSSEYDDYGQQNKLIDANAGETRYEYNAFGEMTSMTNANNQVTQMVYDAVGRITEKTTPSRTITMTYHTQGNGLNQVKSVVYPEGTEEYTYDNLQRPIEVRKLVDGDEFIFTYTYNSMGLVERTTYPSGYFVVNFYDNQGNLTEVIDPNSQVLWEADEQDASGKIIRYTKGDGIQTQLSYDYIGKLKEITAGTVQHHEYLFDDFNGNLRERHDHIKGLGETFAYDDLSRLQEARTRLAANPYLYINLIETEYEPNGNIESKSDVGAYSYDPDKFNAVVHAGNNYEEISFDTQQIDYNAQAKTTLITEGNHKLYLTYGSDEERIMTHLTEMVNGNETTIRRKYFLGLYEKEVESTGERHIHYIMAGDGITAIALTENNATATYFTYKDHLGSIVALTDDQGDVAYEQSFDAWGRYRNPGSWTYGNITESPSWLRGYTGHEHLAEFDLINMNGRMYDPILGRMLRPDNLVQDPMSTQSFNRYSYAWNNPLKFTDPDGEFVASAVLFAAAGAYIFTAWHNRKEGGNPADWNWSWGSGTYKSMITGAVAGFALVAGPVLGGGLTAAGSAAATTTKGTVILSATAKKAIASAYAGGLNAAYNYDKNEGFGWNTVGDFAAGAVGTWVGLSSTLVVGLAVGGAANVAVTPELYTGDITAYRIAQRFVGGALSSYSGMVMGGKYKYFKIDKKFMFRSKTMAKATGKALTYGIQASAADFAYTDQKYYAKRKAGQHAMIFATGLASGFFHYGVGEIGTRTFGMQMAKFGAGAATYFGDYVATTAIQGYKPFHYQYAGKKVGIGLYKNLLFNLIINP